MCGIVVELAGSEETHELPLCSLKHTHILYFVISS